jgi:tungstate transport system substrate-binding protein
VVGSGEALELARRGDIDVLIVHAPIAEGRFVAEGHSARREPLMSNDFVIAGPLSDPAGVRSASDPADGLRRIAASGAGFVSRGDSSGTHERELALWREARTTPARPWYLESGQGQATTLQIASERQAYVLTDRATFDVLSDITDLAPLSGDHASLVNPYSVIVPTNAAHAEEANALADWLVSAAAAAVIDGFRLPDASGPLFRPATRTAPDSSGVPTAPDAPAATEDSVVSSVTPMGDRPAA